MTKVWRFIRKWWWAIVAVAATLFAVIWGFMSKPGKGSGAGAEPALPAFANRAKEEVERVRLEGEVEKARVTATASVHRAEIDRIEELGEVDPKAARRQLSNWLQNNL